MTGDQVGQCLHTIVELPAGVLAHIHLTGIAAILDRTPVKAKAIGFWLREIGDRKPSAP